MLSACPTNIAAKNADARVVADTNILISALMFGGLPGAFFDLAFMRSFVLVTSPALLDELDKKLRLKFKVSAADAALVRSRLQHIADVVSPKITLAVIQTIPMVTACWSAQSGGKHLLSSAATDIV